MRKTKTSTAVKARWNAAHYDRVEFSAPKGWKAAVQTAAESEEKSLAGYIREAVQEKMKRSERK